MQALKALVIFLAVLIVAGMALLVYGLATRTNLGASLFGGGGADAEAGVAAGAGTGAEGGMQGGGIASGRAAVDFGTLELAIPDGCMLAGSELAGDRLVVRFTGQPGRGCQQLVIVDLAGGRELGRVKAVPPTMQAAP